MALLRSRDVDVVGAGDRSSAHRYLGWLCLGVVLARLVYVLQPLRTDEGGYLLVARQWHSSGEFIYGDYHVDRPPLLMLIYRVAALSDWDPLIRVLAVPFALVFVVAAWRAGELLGGALGARWSAVVAAGLMCSPAMASDQADGELFAASLVMVAVALGLTAWRSASDPGRAHRLAAAAGLFAGAAPLVKQNFVEGLVFLAILLAAAVWQHRRVGPREVVVGLGALVGALLPHLLVWLWAASHGVEAGTVWSDLVGFRGAAFDVIWSNRPEAAISRGARLVLLGLVSGVLLVLFAWLASSRPWRLRGTPEQWATTGVLLFSLAAITAGGSYWPHYLLGLAPGVVLAVGAVAPQASTAGRRMRTAGGAVVAAAVLGTVLVEVVYLSVPRVWWQQRAGEWLAESGNRGDTAVVLYGNATVLEVADMDSPYPYLWSLPMRTLDPDQSRLRGTLTGAEAPTWVVQVNPIDSWGIDVDARLEGLLDERYRVVSDVCGYPMWLREDLVRDLAPSPRC
ncbi:MAG: hypothetical protein ACM3XQ_11105 [Nocardioidaceae bacterium]